MATLAEFVEEFAKKTDLSKAEADRVARTYAEIAKKFAKKGFVTLPELGRFKKVERKARKARNPRTGAMVNVPKKTYLALKIEV